MRRLLLAISAVLGCGTSTPPPAPACDAADAIVAVSDYASSLVGAVALDGGAALFPGTDLGKDPALAVSRGRAFFVARQEGTVFELDPRCGRATAKFSVNDPAHAGTSNPQDAAASPDGAVWVPRFNVPSIAIARGGSVAATIDISSYDGDGNPNANAIRIVDVAGAPKAFVTLERLDDNDQLKSKQPSMMLRIDVLTRTVEAAIPLAGRNPFNTMFEQGGLLYLAAPGSFDVVGEADAGIERFDTKTSATRLIVREADLGASVVEVAVSGRCGAAIVADATPTVNATSLVTFDAESGAVLARGVLGPTEDFDRGLRGLTWTAGGRVLLVGDRRRSDKGYPVHAFDRDEACALHARADTIFLGQKPISVKHVE